MNKELLEKLYNDGLFFLAITSLISSDNLNTVEDYERSLEILNQLKEVLPTTNIPKDEWEDLVERGIKILKRND